MSSWNDQKLRKLFLGKTPLIDVRAPVEFQAGAIPFSENLPILNDEERALIGTCYKEHGQEAAIALGHHLVTGTVKEERVKAWMNFLRQHPEGEVFCFRGGLRSKTACQWIKDAGLERTPIEGGYKRLRNFFLSWIDEAPLPQIIRIGGPTGSAKTEFLHPFPHIDLEALANHRGSAFGSMGTQPAQVTFENLLGLELLRHEGQTILVEDESAMIGKITVPKRFFQHLRSTPVVVLRVPQAERIQHILNTYVKGRDLAFFESAVFRIQRSLGGMNFDRVLNAVRGGFARDSHEEWISLLIELYYDPMYEYGIKKYAPEILMEGTPGEVREFLKERLKLLPERR